MRQSIPYENLKHFVFRSPLLPINSLDKNFIKSDIFKEAIYLASPDFYQVIIKEEGKDFSEMKLKTQLSLLKYLIRMSNRCTPFGLFAGCGVGKITSKSDIQIEGIGNYTSHTRLDMHYLCALAQKLVSDSNIRERLYFYPNSSLYKVKNEYRYVEYVYINGKRKHYLTAIENNPYVEKILKLSEMGANLKALEAIIASKHIKKREAAEFIEELISNQVLISNLEPSVTGNDLLSKILNKITDTNQSSNIESVLKKIQLLLKNIDNANIGRDVRKYQKIEYQAKKLTTQYESRYLFQSDLLISTTKAELSIDLVEEIKDGLRVIKKLSQKQNNNIIKQFKEEFYKRYETEEVPLVEVLDPDIGIGFSNLFPASTDLTPLVDEVGLVSKNVNPTLIVDNSELFIIEKYKEFLHSSSNEVIITDDEIKSLSENWDDLPPTFSTMVEVIRTESRKDKVPPLIIMRSSGGSSAANLLGRLSHVDKNIYELVDQIFKHDDKILGEDKIIAEIVHLPESRVGNILNRFNLRRFEIAYLAGPSIDKNYVIPISDLMISIADGNYIRLRSKKFDKEIIPRLTNAHNFSYNSLPIYHFLCQLQFEGFRSGLYFNWGNLLRNMPFLPRVRYRNIILSPSIWNISSKIIEDAPKITDSSFYNWTLNFKENNAIPNNVLLVKGDNKLLIDFKDKLSVQLLFSEVKKRSFVLEEAFSSDFSYETALVRNEHRIFNNQVILSFCKINQEK